MDDPLLIDLARDGKVLQASDEFLNPAERLLEPAEPVDETGRFGPHGARLDGWETRRVRPPGHEWAIVRLGRRGVLRRLVVDTTHVHRSLPAAYSVEAVDLPGDPSLVDLVRSRSRWSEVIPRTAVGGAGRHIVEVGGVPATHLRLVIYPDGGVARLRALGEPLPPADLADRGTVDLAAAAHGGLTTAVSDATSTPNRMLAGGDARDAGDGWVTRRRRDPGHEWAVVRLAGRGMVERIETDLRRFPGDAPEEIAVLGADLPDGDPAGPEGPWAEVVPQQEAEADARNRFDLEEPAGPFTHLRLDLHPDGAVGRFRAFGTVWSEGDGEDGAPDEG
ncbi:MAG: allantoicase [Actinobacteria bacterium]|nr:allantoicase [Actinomycetota bacterium]